MQTDRLITTFLPIKREGTSLAARTFSVQGKEESNMFLVLFLLWVVFNGKLNWEIAIFGVVLSAAVYAFSCAFLEYSPKKDLAAVKKIPRVLKYLWLLVCEIIKSNRALIAIVYSRKAKEIKPQLVTFKTPLKGAAKSVLADSITVTPGTISVHCEGDKLTVHALDKVFAQGIEDTDFQKQLFEMSSGEEKA